METKRAKLVEDEMGEINQNNSTTIDALPPQVLIHILEFLSPIERIRSERVCKKWRNASRQTWRDVQTLYIINPGDIEYHAFEDGTEFVEKELNQLFVGSDSSKIIRCLVSRVGCFIKKFVYDYGITNYHEVILSIVSCYCRNLKVLVLKGIKEMSIDEQLLLILFECNQKLHSFKCTYEGNWIEAIPLRHWRSLRFQDQEVDKCHEEKIVSLIEYSRALEEFDCDMYTTRIVEALLKLPNLKSLYLTTDLDEKLFKMILHVPLLNRLRNLVFTDCVKDSDLHMVSNLLQHCCQLKRLSIDCGCYADVSPTMLLEAILALPNLETLQISFDSMDDDALIQFTKFRNLQLCDNIDLLTNNGIFQMIKNSEFLENLDIEDTKVTPEMFRQLVREMNNRHKYLKVRVHWIIFDEVSEICKGSKIRVVNYPSPCFSD